MIYVEVTKCSDPLALGTYEFEFDQVSIGRSKRNDLIFTDQELPLKYLILKNIEDQFTIQSMCRSPFYFVNGKKVSGLLKIKIGDTIAFGPNEIRIIKSSLNHKSIDFPNLYTEFTQSAPEIKFVLDFIEEVLIDLEKEKENHV